MVSKLSQLSGVKLFDLDELTDSKMRKILEADEACQNGMKIWGSLVSLHPDKMAKVAQSLTQERGRIEMTDYLGWTKCYAIRRSSDTGFSAWKACSRKLASAVVNQFVKEKTEMAAATEVVGPRQKSRIDQEFFQRSRSSVTQELSLEIQEGASWDQLFQKACQWRKECALGQLDAAWDTFGVERILDNTPLTTNIADTNGVYLAPKIDAYIAEKPQSVKWQRGFCMTNITTRTIVGKTSEGREVPLTILARFDNPPKKREFEEIFGRTEGPIRVWQHTNPKYIPLAMAEAERYYQMALRADSKESAVEAVARLHWWGCHACPCHRGSAAVMEAITQAILDAKDTQLVRKEDALIDVEILSEPNEDEFVKIYLNFYNSSAN